MSGPRIAAQQDVQPSERRVWQRGLLNRLLSNPLLELNNQGSLNMLYHWHRRTVLLCADEANCQGIHVRATAL